MENYRILEYKDHFRIQKKITVNVFFKILGIPLFLKRKEEKWLTVLKNKTILQITNCLDIENYEFKTKEECLQLINDFQKYPIIHNL